MQRNFVFFIIGSLFIVLIVFKKNVFGLEVRVRELDFMKKINGFEGLLSNRLDKPHRKRLIVVFL
jgi:hypothetical protein